MSMKINKSYPQMAALFVAVVFGLSFLFTKDALLYLNPFQLLGLRFALAAFSLTLLAVIGLIKLKIKLSDVRGLLKIAIWQPVLYFTFETYGVKYTSASEAGVIIALVPVIVTVMSMYILRERISAGQSICIGAAVTGVILMSLGQNGTADNSQGSHLIGILMLFGAVLAAGFFNIFSRSASSKYSPVDITFTMMWLGAIVFNLVGITQSYLNGQLSNYAAALQQYSVITGLLYLGLLSSVVAFFLLNYSLSRMTASRVAVFFNLTPLVSVLAGVLIYGERLGTWQIAGCIFILVGVWGTNYLAATIEGTPDNRVARSK